jgi:hypothetical protein
MVDSLTIGDGIRITGGIHEGQTGTIRRVNATRHWVSLEPNIPGNFFIPKALCQKIASRVLVDRLERDLPLDEVSDGNLSAAFEEEVAEGEEEEVAEGEEMEESSGDEEQSTTFGGHISIIFLLNFASQSIATMSDENTNNLQEWQRLLRTRILHYRPDYPQEEEEGA